MGARPQSTAADRHNQDVDVRAASWDDLEQVTAAIGAQNRAATGRAGIEAEQVRADWSLSGFELGEDAVVAEEDGRLAGYAAVKPSGELVVVALDDALADELLVRSVDRARRRGLGAVTLSVLADPSPLASLARRHPFALAHETLLMWRPLARPVEAPGPPAGLTIRTFEPADAEAVHRLLDEAYGAWDPLYVPMAHADWVSWMTGDPEFDSSVWWLAERDGALAGCALHWSSGWLKDVAVRDSERGRGLGAALVETGLAEFSRRGAARVGLKVDTGNPTGAVRLYERLGFVTASREAVWLWNL
jgi:GNAT superfamily N-acetyltransferase